MKIISTILIVSGIIINIIISGCGSKEENKTTDKESNNKTQTQPQITTQTQGNTNVSEIGKIWSQIEKINSSMGKGINSGKSGHLEEPVGEIISLIKTIPENSANLPPASLDLIKSKVNELRKTGASMDKYQHNNKTSELKEEYQKFIQTLDEIKNVIPE